MSNAIPNDEAFVPLVDLRDRFRASTQTLKARCKRAHIPLYNLNPGGARGCWAILETDVELLAVTRHPTRPLPYFPQHEPSLAEIQARLYGH